MPGPGEAEKTTPRQEGLAATRRPRSLATQVYSETPHYSLLLDGYRVVELRPSEAAVLLAISNGIDTVDAVARALNTSKETVEQIVGELEAKGLVERHEEGRIIKRRKLRLTRQGLDALAEARRQLDKLLEAYQHYRREKALPTSWVWGLDEFLLALPLLALLGIVPAIEIIELLGAATEAEDIVDYEEAYDDMDDDWVLDE